MSKKDTRLRPDFALQMWMRTLPPANRHEQVEYNILVSASEELKRLYELEFWVGWYLEAPCEKRLECLRREFAGEVLPPEEEPE